MKIPQPPPKGRLSPDKFANFLGSEPLRKLITRANEEYLYWDKLKYKPMPEGLPPEEVWHYLKLVRGTQRRATPIRDSHNHYFTYWLPDAAQRHLHTIDMQAAGRIGADQSILSSASRDRYLVSSLMEEAIASSQIEGAATTRAVAKEMLRTGRKPQNKAERMIVNNYLTIMKLRNISSQQLTPDVLKNLHISMTEGTLQNPEDAGRYRRDEDQIVVQDQGVTLHIPPSANLIPRELDRLCRFANEDKDDHFMHPVVKGILLHFWIGYLHPYIDGNGRTARALFYWYMLSRGYWLFEFLSISQAILKGRAKYDKAFLYSEIDGLDSTYFVMFNLETVVKSLNKLHEYLERKQLEASEMGVILSEITGLNYRQQALLRKAIQNSDAQFTIASHMNSHNIAYATSRSDLFDLAERGLLTREKIGRKILFLVPNDLGKRLSKS
ncbi:MAG: Fic family protein [Thermoleophilia bacterium]